MNALMSIQQVMRETREKFPPPKDPIKEILVGYELKQEIEKVAMRAGPVTDPWKCCGVPIHLRPGAFPVGAEVMGAIIYVDEKKWPILIIRTKEVK